MITELFEEKTDIIIVGAGINGLATALGMANLDLSVTILERNQMPDLTLPVEPDLRVYAINQSSQQLMENLSVWTDIKESRITPYQGMKVWEDGAVGQLEFDGHSIGVPELGYIVEDTVIKTALIHACQKHRGIKLRYSTELSSIVTNENSVSVECTDGRLVKGILLIGSDGANSWVRSHLGIETTQQSYGQEAIVATIHTEKPHQYIARQRFLNEGPLALLPLWNEHQSSIVWSCFEEQAQYLKSLSDSEFNLAIMKASNSVLGDIELASKRVSFPLKMRHAKHYIDNRTALIGDVIHTFHPLAGQGLNLGLSDVAKLLDVVSSASAKSQDIASHAILRRYERARKLDVNRMIRLMALFHHGFTSQVPGLKPLRNIAMTAVNRLSPLKSFFLNQAMNS